MPVFSFSPVLPVEGMKSKKIYITAFDLNVLPSTKFKKYVPIVTGVVVNMCRQLEENGCNHHQERSTNLFGNWWLMTVKYSCCHLSQLTSLLALHCYLFFFFSLCMHVCFLLASIHNQHFCKHTVDGKHVWKGKCASIKHSIATWFWGHLFRLKTKNTSQVCWLEWCARQRASEHNEQPVERR